MNVGEDSSWTPCYWPFQPPSRSSPNSPRFRRESSRCTGFPLVEAVLAAASASRNSGLLVCWVLALAPVVGPLAVYRGFRYVRGSGPVALPLSFSGVGAAEFRVPTALLPGTVAFCVGAGPRRIARLFRGA